MIIDHIGIAVRSIETTTAEWHNVLGYHPVTEIVRNSRQKVRVLFLSKPGSIDIKLIEPADSLSPISEFVRKGGGLHHLCMRCKDLDSELARLASIGVRTLVAPEPGEAFCGERIAFIYARGIGLNLELIDTLKRACPLNARSDDRNTDTNLQEPAQ